MLKLRINDGDLQSALKAMRDSEVRTAGVWALNDTAADVLEHVQNKMTVVFDNPTRFTKNAFMVWRARPKTLEARVQERPSVASRHYLKIQETGGKRGQTGLEKLLDSRLAYAGQISAITPASGARFNAYGNWSTGQRNQALSAVQSQRDRTANTTKASRKRNRKRAGYFVPATGSKLSPGIWQRMARGQLRKVVHFTTRMPVYDRRLGFFDGASEVYVDRFPVHLRRTLKRAAERAAARRKS